MHPYRDDKPPRPGPSVPIIRIKGGEQRLFIVLSPAMIGYWTHWGGRATVPCTTKALGCAGCHARPPWPMRWKGYLHALCLVKHYDCFIELTPVAAEMLTLQIDNGVSLRGLKMEIRRSPGTNGRLKLIVHGKPTLLKDLPEPKDPMISLDKLWGLNQREENDGQAT